MYNGVPIPLTIFYIIIFYFIVPPFSSKYFHFWQKTFYIPRRHPRDLSVEALAKSKGGDLGLINYSFSFSF